MNWRRFFCCCCSFEEKDQIGENKSRDYPWEIYTLKEILHATNNFHDDNKIGEGGFGSVYWGRTSKGIAVKRLKGMSSKAEMEFAVEVEILGRVRHKNLLGLRGFYASADERLIVYDYMPNHSLTTHLHGQLAADCFLDWPRRMSIAIGSAEGLVARKPLEKLPGGVKRDIVQWVTPYVKKGAFDRIADPRLQGKFDRAQLKSAVMVALRCTESNPENRPSMLEVVKWLKGGVEIRKVVTDIEHMLEEDGDNETDTDFEGFRIARSKQFQS
ncbi:hypothetical protein V6N11_075608 [Hibiscus sabdariffa]|uniref:Protein kinase domain-containing protein n=1 Tax=Hibiscus sabdariffa TaxID=183260 RepID=A0ABR2R6Z3_9ROSI